MGTLNRYGAVMWNTDSASTHSQTTKEVLSSFFTHYKISLRGLQSHKGTNLSDLHCTVTCALAVTCVTLFSALHTYVPASVLLLFWMSTVLPTWFPSLVHVMVGVGWPLALQVSWRRSPSLMVLCWGASVIVGGTGNHQRQTSQDRQRQLVNTPELQPKVQL